MNLSTSETITFLLASLRGGGAEHVILTVAKALSEHGYRVDLVLLKAEGAHLANVPKSINLVDLNASRSLFSIPRLVSYFLKEKPLVLFSSLPHVSIVTLAARSISFSSSQVYVVEHNTISQSVRHSHTFRGKLLPYIMRLMYPSCSGIICVSQGVARDLASEIKIPNTANQMTVIYNPVITSEMINLSRLPPNHPWLIDDSVPVVLGVGRLMPAKNFQLLIKAFHNLLDTIPARLIILGEGPERPRLERLVKELDIYDRVALPGFVHNPYVYFRNSSVFVLSSLWEGLPTVLIEALACGTQVVSTDCKSGPREILQDGKLGTLVPIDQSDALSDAIKYALINPTPPIEGHNLTEYTADYSVTKYQDIIDNIQE